MRRCHGSTAGFDIEEVAALAEPMPGPGKNPGAPQYLPNEQFAPWLQPSQSGAPAGLAPPLPVVPVPASLPPATPPLGAEQFVPVSSNPAPTAPSMPEPFAPATSLAPAPSDGPGWGVREQRAAPPVFGLDTTIPPPPPPFQPAALYVGAQDPWLRPPVQQRGRRRGLLGALVVIGLLIGVRFALGMGTKELITATNKTYHLPAAIGSYALSNDPSLTSTLAQLKQSIQLPSLQNAHTEANAYEDSTAKLGYMMMMGQDNLGHLTPRQGMDLQSMFAGVPLTGQVTRNSNDMVVNCATADSSGNSYQACAWYMSNAAGLFWDGTSASPGASADTLMKTLQTMSS